MRNLITVAQRVIHDQFYLRLFRMQPAEQAALCLSGFKWRTYGIQIRNRQRTQPCFPEPGPDLPAVIDKPVSSGNEYLRRMDSHGVPFPAGWRTLQCLISKSTHKRLQFFPFAKSVRMRAEDMPERKIEKFRYILPVLHRSQSFREKQPGTGIPVISGKQKFSLRHIDHSRAGRMSRTCYDLRSETSKLYASLLHRYKIRHAGVQVLFRAHVNTGCQCFCQYLSAPFFSCILPSSLLFRLQDGYRRKKPRPHHMVMMRVGKEYLQRKIGQG